ncbi:MAG: alanine--glyoxylate aminotransferase family protein [Clostridia bacterium]|nr:alanine--glyoxylate aminotransferase family protein [Clostridia bacterium]
MINFTVGPVQSDEVIRSIGAEQVPYFRTPEFSKIMIENEKLMLKFCKAPQGSRSVFITGSGTASMEASIINVLSKNDKALVVNGGSFGQRFVEMLTIHEIPFTEIKLNHGQVLTSEILLQYNDKGYTAFLIQGHETSTGVKYDLEMVSRFCKNNNLIFIVDAISLFLSDEFNMANLAADVMITGSQKALACPPGVSIIVLSPKALNRIEKNNPHCMYLDLKLALSNGERGQTPFTPAVGVLRQINIRLKNIDDNGGVETETARIKSLAEYFRAQIKDLPFEIVSESMSNAVTPLHPLTASAYDIFTILKNEYGIWVCPNGGDMKETIFRVGHIGNLSKTDYDKLINAFYDMQNKKII